MKKSRGSSKRLRAEATENSHADAAYGGPAGTHFLTCTQGGSNKFYEIRSSDNTVYCKYGRIGSEGVTQVKSFEAEGDDASPAVANYIQKVLRDKEKKGYILQPPSSRDEVKTTDVQGSKRIKREAKPVTTAEPDDNNDGNNDGDDNLTGKMEEDEGEEQLEGAPSLDPMALDLLRGKLKKGSGRGKSKGSAAESAGPEIVSDLHDGALCAVSLTMPATSPSAPDKFYIIQLVTLGDAEFYLFSRWGLEGEDGHTELSPQIKSLPSALQTFEQRFKIKTAVQWKERAHSIPQPFHFYLPSSTASAPSHRVIPATAQSSSPVGKAGDSRSTARAGGTEEARVVRLVYLECREGSSDKFYELKQTADHSVTIRYGRRLASGVSSTKEFSTEAKAKSFVDKTAIAKQRKGYCNAQPPDGAECEEDEAPTGGSEGPTGDQTFDLENGHRVFVQGSSKLPYTLKKFNGGYSCTCMGWVSQIRMKGVQAASCKHLKQVRGEEAEAARCQSSAGVVANPSSNANKNPSIVSKISLAQKWKPSIDPAGYLMSEKLDGMRAYWCGKKLWTRSGLPVITPDWFTLGLPADTELDGELFLGRKMFDECMSITRRTDASDDWKKIKYVVFDAPKTSGGIGDRLAAAERVLAESGNTYAILHPHTLCEGMDHLLQELAATEAAGGEGMMLRSASARHRGGRSVDLLKVKSFHDDEAIVTDYEAGKGKYAGMVGSLVCRSRHGAAFKVGSGLVDSQRSYQSKSLPQVGSVITFQYFELTKDRIPRFPTFLRIRPDVDASAFS